MYILYIYIHIGTPSSLSFFILASAFSSQLDFPEVFASTMYMQSQTGALIDVALHSCYEQMLRNLSDELSKDLQGFQLEVKKKDMTSSMTSSENLRRRWTVTESCS